MVFRKFVFIPPVVAKVSFGKSFGILSSFSSDPSPWTRHSDSSIGTTVARDEKSILPDRSALLAETEAK
jgi:hypothetical protein